MSYTLFFQFHPQPPVHQPALLGVTDAPDPAGLGPD